MKGHLKIKVAICGINGKMGKILAEEIENSEIFSVAFGVDSLGIQKEQPTCNYKTYPSFRIAEKANEVCDGIIDFSSPQALNDVSTYALKHDVFLLLAVTGYDKTQLKKIDELSKLIRLRKTENTSQGITVLKKVLPVLKNQLNGYRISLTEKHGIKKKDTPSGTAIALAELLGDVKTTSVREGDLPGTHIISFDNGIEKITITHNALSRKVFAKGALKAAEELYFLKR